MPPTIGTAIRLMTSDSVPVPHHMIGNKPAMIATNVIILRLPLNLGVHSSARIMPGKERRDEPWSVEQSQVHLGVQARSR